MKKIILLSKAYLYKEKIGLLFIIFLLLNISMFVTFQGSIFSLKDYSQTYQSAGLDFFYYLHTIGISPFFFFIFMLLMTNIVSYDFLNHHQQHYSYHMILRLDHQKYYRYTLISNFIYTFTIMLLLEGLILMIIHFFYIPLSFAHFTYPDMYYAKTLLFSNNPFISLIIFIIITSLGYSLISTLIFTLQVFIINKYVYRCIGVIIGILLVAGPALIQGYFPNPDLPFLFQINNLVALGMENVRENSFGLPHLILYTISFLMYTGISYASYRFLQKWRRLYD